jgi:tocopherol O-methyltransferase
MPDLASTFDEVRRILRPGGRFVACVWLAGARVAGWRERHLVYHIRREGRLARLATAAEIESAMEAAGLEVERFEDLSHRVRRTWTVAGLHVLLRLIRDPEARRFVASGGEAVFVRSVARIWLAYRVGAMRYGVFTARRA